MLQVCILASPLRSKEPASSKPCFPLSESLGYKEIPLWSVTINRPFLFRSLFSLLPFFSFFLPFFLYMKAKFTAKAVLSKMQWLWLILSQPYYLAARWSAVLKWIMNPWNWLSVTFIILMERQVRSGLTTSHANQTTTVTSACLKAFICPESKVMP